eukprot:TRINITY_DN12381_c0_g1_i1.p1 TRINITY_DN12381_c0_g1~~TRINITY_DN12381_c0_g1_i1.p1  ORF type:complete len:1000 (+),score=204.10 TRINITY_DN12381_c0_g1_i1:2145-5144(+)
MASLPPLRPSSLTWGDIPIGSPSKNYSWDQSNGPPSPEVLDIKLMRYLDESQHQSNTLRTLEFNENRFNPEAVVELLDILGHSTELETFIISKCAHIRESDLEDICVALQDVPSLQVVRFEGLNLSEAGCSFIVDLMEANTSITELSLARNQLSRPHIRILEDGLARATNLQTLNLSRNSLNTKDAEHILQAIQSNTCISYLDLSRNVSIGVAIRIRLLHALAQRQGQLVCDDYTLITLLEKMEHSEGLTKLDFSQGHWDLDAACWKGFAHELRTNTSLVSLSMADCDLKPPVVRSLATALKHNTQLKQINLSYNPGIRIACKHLLAALGFHPNIEDVKLHGCELGVAEAPQLACMLEQTATISYLGLKDNHLGTEGACLIANALKLNTSLTTLNLSKNQIDDAGAQALAQRLQHASHLRRLPIYQNTFTWPGLLALAGMAMAKQPILILEMDKVETAVALTRLINNDPTLTHLELEYSGLDGPGMDIFLSSLTKCQHLTKLDLRGLHFDATMAEQLYKALQASKGIKHLRLDGAEVPFSFKLRLVRLFNRRQGVVEDRHASALNQLVRVMDGDGGVTELDTRGMTLDEHSHKLLAKALRMNTALITLKYDLSLLSSTSRVAVLDGIRTNRSIHTLMLQMHAPDVQDRQLLSSVLAAHPKLQSLTLRIQHDHLSDDCVRAISDALVSTQQLSALRIEYVGMTARGADILLQGIAQLQQLTQLSLHNVSWAADSGSQLVTTVHQLPSLIHLDVVDTCVSLVNLVKMTDIVVAREGSIESGFEDGVADLRRLHANSDECLQFDLVCPFKDGLYQDTLESLCHALTRNTKLQRLSVKAAHLSDQDTARLLQAVVNNPNLQALILDDTEVDTQCITAAAALLRHSERLVTLELHGSSENTESSCQPLVSALRSNRSLLNLGLRLPRGPVARRLNKLLRITPWRWFLHRHFEPAFRQRVLLIFAMKIILDQANVQIPEAVWERVCLHLSQLELRLPQLPRLLDE